MPFSSIDHTDLKPDPMEAELRLAFPPLGEAAAPIGPQESSSGGRQVRGRPSPRGRRKAVQSAVGEISSLLLKDMIDWQQLCALVLKHCLAITGSKLGFASVVDRSDGGTEAHAIVGAPVMPALPERRLDALRADGVRPCLWGIEPDTNRPFYTNSPSRHPLWKGTGDARAAIRNLLSIPVFLGFEQVGLIALADSKTGYRASDLKALTPVADIYAKAIRHKRTAEELGRKSRELQQRVNELNCIFQISEVCERRLPFEAICARVVEVIRSAFAYPSFVSVILDIDGESYMDGSTARPVYIMSSKLVISGLKRGRIKVLYHGAPERRTQFSSGEQRLLDEVARKFTRSIESMELAVQLKRARDGLEQKVSERTAELRLSNRYLMAMGNLNRYLLSAGDEAGLCEYACDLMVNTCGHGTAWVGIRGDDLDDRMNVVASSGIELSAVREPVESQDPEERWFKLPLWLKNGMLNGILAVSPTEGSPLGEMEKGFIEDFADELSLGLSSIWTKIEHDLAQKELLNQTRSLEEARKMEVFGRLAGSVAHEVRNPLNAIMGITEALDRRLGGAAQYKPFINHMSEQVERLSKLMKDLLDLGRPVDEARMQVHSVAELCGSAFILWRRGDLGSACGASFEITDAAKDMNVLCDAGKIGQVLINLLDNAVQNGSDAVNIRLSVARTADDRALVKISDQGKGVPEDILPRVFEPFFTSRRGGMGLGLSIVKHIVDLHEGTVSIYNNPDGAGCSVEVTLPVVQ